MSAYDLDPNAGANIMDQARMNPLRPDNLAPAWYAGAWKAPVTGLASAWNDAALLVGDAVTPALREAVGKPIDKMFGTKVDDWLVSEQQKAVDNIKGWGPDPHTTGVLGHAVHGLFNIIPEALAGGPEVAGILQGYKGYRGGMADGLDANTAFGKGAIDGITAWAGMKIPLTLAPKLGAAANVAASGAANVGFGMTSRGVTSEFLRHNGYADMADQYKVLDESAMVVDLIIGGGFGALAHYGPTGRALRNEVMTDRVQPSDVDAALVLNSQLHVELDTAPGIPTTPAARAAHVDTMNRSLESLLLGEPVNVDQAVVRAEFIENPTAAETRAQVREAVADHMGPEWRVFEAELRARGLPLDDIDSSAVVRFSPEVRAPDAPAEAKPEAQGKPAETPATEKKAAESAKSDWQAKAAAKEAKLAAQLETANRNAASRAAAREARTAASDDGATAPHEVATHADQVDVTPIMAEHAAMEIAGADGAPLQAADVLAHSDAEIASAKQDSQGFEAAITCLLRN